MRRLRAPDKSRAGAPSAVSMEERAEEAGGSSSRKNAATVRAASLPPSIGVTSCRRCGGRRCLLLLLAPGKDLPAAGQYAGRAAGVPLCGGDSTGEGQGRASRRRKGKPQNKTRVSPLKCQGDSGSGFRGLSPKWRFPPSRPTATRSAREAERGEAEAAAAANRGWTSSVGRTVIG